LSPASAATAGFLPLTTFFTAPPAYTQRLTAQHQQQSLSLNSRLLALDNPEFNKQNQDEYTETNAAVSTFLGTVVVDADNLGGPPGLIFGPDGFDVTAATEAVPADDGLPTTTAFSQHSFIYSTHTSPSSLPLSPSPLIHAVAD